MGNNSQNRDAGRARVLPTRGHGPLCVGVGGPRGSEMTMHVLPHSGQTPAGHEPGTYFPRSRLARIVIFQAHAGPCFASACRRRRFVRLGPALIATAGCPFPSGSCANRCGHCRPAGINQGSALRSRSRNGWLLGPFPTGKRYLMTRGAEGFDVLRAIANLYPESVPIWCAAKGSELSRPSKRPQGQSHVSLD